MPNPVDEFGLAPKARRTAELAWKTLISEKALRIPTSPRDRAAWFGETPMVRLGEDRTVYLSLSAAKAAHSLVETLYEIPDIAAHHSLSEFDHCFADEYDRCWQDAVRVRAIEEFHEFMPQFLKIVRGRRRSRRFYRLVTGLTLSDIDTLRIGAVTIRKLEATELPVAEHVAPATKENREILERFLEKEFFSGLCFIGEYAADAEKSQELFEADCRRALDILRLAICLRTASHAADSKLRVRFASDGLAARHAVMSLDISTGSLGRSLGIGTRPHGFTLSQEGIVVLTNDWGWDDLCQIAAATSRTEFEEIILRALRWLSDAQDDYDRESAYVKYWTCLETVFTGNEKNVTENLARSVSVLLTRGNRPHVDPSTFWKLFADVRDLYTVRNDIVHRGLAKRLTNQCLIDVRNYAVHVIMNLLELRKPALRDRKHLRKEINRLFVQIKRQFPRPLCVSLRARLACLLNSLFRRIPEN